MSEEHTPDPRCESCFYWRWYFPMDEGSPKWNQKCCHYCLDNKMTRARDGDNCASYLHKSKRRVNRLFNPDLRALRDPQYRKKKYLKIVSPRRGWTSY